MPFFVTAVDPAIGVSGPYQNFAFGDQQPDALFRLSTLFEPTNPSIPSNLKFDLLNYASKGIRMGILTPQGQTKPVYIMSTVEPTGTGENATLTSSPIFSFNEAQNSHFRAYFPINSPDPITATHLATKGYVDTAVSSITPGTSSINMQGDIIGSGPLSSPVTTKLNTTLDKIDIASYLDLKNFNIVNMKNPINDQDGTPMAWVKGYVDNKTWTASQITDFPTSVLAFKLNQFAKPTDFLDINNQNIKNGKDPIDAQDLTTKAWVTTLVNSITPATPSLQLTGDISASGTLPGPIITTLNTTLDQIDIASYLDLKNFNAVNMKDPVNGQDGVNKRFLEAKRLNQWGAPIADVNLNNYRIVNLLNPTNPQDGSPKSYVDTSIADALASVTPTIGNFTPVICDLNGNDIISSPAGLGYDVKSGKYFKLGKFVYASIRFSFSGNSYPSYSDSTPLYLSGLPYAPNYSDLIYVPVMYTGCAVNNIISLFIQLNPSSTIHSFKAIFQSQNQLIMNPEEPLLKSEINSKALTTFTINFSYMTNT